MDTTQKYTNRLAKETSPYLLQHAHNPVDWYPWGAEAFQKAKDEDKLLIISIGYSSCHWCHVMERECFEDEQIAKLMNAFYVCVKVDREERPDVDALYMDAVNVMSGRGGWPLNAFIMPDGRPVYAGTYFPKNQWSGLLREIASGYRRTPEKYIAYAEKLMQGIKGLSIVEEPKTHSEFTIDQLKGTYLGFSMHFDKTHGGRGRAPKFPMPDNYLFLLRYAHATGSKQALEHVFFTLDKMAKGGIYDQVGGGFARYSTDSKWHIPHFEKMLYDNAQLISLYAEAWQLSKREIYKDVVYQTIAFIKRELTSPDGAFYSALDADTEGVEGKYYVWSEADFTDVVGPDDADMLKDFFGIGADALWENDYNIPIQTTSIAEIGLKYSLSEDEVKNKINTARGLLLLVREKRIRPGLDNKVLLSWNALMIKALLDAHRIFNDAEFKAIAEEAICWIKSNLVRNKKLYRTVKNGEPAIPAFLEDYALYIQLLIHLYQVDFEEKHLQEAKELTDFVINVFSDENKNMFYFTPNNTEESLAARKIELTDNVIPSPNSVMAHNIFILGLYFNNESYISRSEKMLSSVLPQLIEYAPFFSNWGSLLTCKAGRFYEVAIVGENFRELKHFIEEVYMPNKIIAGNSSSQSILPLLQDRFVQDKTFIYVCENKTCNLPVENAKDAIAQMSSDI